MPADGSVCRPGGEQEVAEDIRSAVDTIEGRTSAEAALATATAAKAGKVHLHAARKEKHTIGKASFPEIGAARLKSVESQGEVIHAVANWKTSLVKLKAHQGRLVAECCGRASFASPIIEPVATPGIESVPYRRSCGATAPLPPPELLGSTMPQVVEPECAADRRQ